jgi:hypothetical protein
MYFTRFPSTGSSGGDRCRRRRAAARSGARPATAAGSAAGGGQQIGETGCGSIGSVAQACGRRRGARPAEKWLRQSSGSEHHHGGNAKSAFSRQRSGGMGQRGAAGEDEEKRAPVMVMRSRMRTRSRCTRRRQKCSSKVRFLFDSCFNKFRNCSSNVALCCRQVHRQQGAVKGELRVPELLPRAAGDKGRGGEGRRHGDDAARQLHNLRGATRRSRARPRHGTTPRRTGLARWCRTPAAEEDISELADCHLAKLDLGARFDAMLVNWSSQGRGVQEPQALRGEHCRWCRVTVR